MKKKRLRKALSLLLTLVMLTAVGCGTNNPSETAYWFSKSSTEFIAYNDESNNLDEAGSYWNFTVARTADITLYVRMNVDNHTSYTSLHLNDEQVQSETDTGIYTYAYKLSLKKGDKLKIHAKWISGLYSRDEGFNIIMMSIKYDGKQYVINEFDQSTTK